MGDLERRLRTLERANVARGCSAALIVVSGGDREPVGICAVEGRLPEIERMPGESWSDCIERAVEMVRGLGPVMAMARYRDESGTDGLASPET